MLVNAKLSWQHAVLSALVMSSAVSANYGSLHVRRGEHAVRDILPNQEHNLKERDLLSTLSGLLGGAGAGAGNDDNAAEAAAGQQQQAGKNKGQADDAAAGAGEAAAGQDEEAQGDAAQGEAAQGEAAQGEDAQEAAQGQGKGQAKGQGKGQNQDEGAAAAGEAAAGGEAGSKFENFPDPMDSGANTHTDAAGAGGMNSLSLDFKRTIH